MAISLKKIGSAIKSYASNVVGGAKIVGGAIGGAIKSIGNSIASTPTNANVIFSQPTKTSTTAPTTESGGWTSFRNLDGSYTAVRSGTPEGQVQALVPGVVARGGSPIYSAPTTIPGGGTNRLTNLGSSSPNAPIGSQAMAPTSPISVPSAPTYSNPGIVNNGGLVSTLTDHVYDPVTNTFNVRNSELTPEEKQKINNEKAIRTLIPEKDNVYENPEIIKQNAEVQARKQEVANYTSQLNSIVAQQNADLLRLRGVGSQEGVTETVYGGQAAQINREAAIKALPIQAQIASAQGNLQLAQDYLTQLTTWKKEEVDNDYNHRKAVYDAISGSVTREEQRQFDKLKKEDERAWELKSKQIGSLDSLIKEYKGNPSAIGALTKMYDRVGSPTFGQEIGKILSTLPANGGGNGEYSKALQFVKDNPTASPQELEQAIRKNVKNLTEAEIKSALASRPSAKFLDANYFRKIFTTEQLKASAKDSGYTAGGFLGFGVGDQGISDYLDHLVGIVEQYRLAGFSDEEILKMMQK